MGGRLAKETVCKAEDKVTQPPEDIIAAEGDTVTLECTFESSYTTAQLNMLWYKQEVNGFPKYILRRGAYGDDNAPEFHKDRFDAQVNKKSVPLKIQKLQLSDSAVYYCALKPTVTGNSEILSPLSLMDNMSLMASFSRLFPGLIAETTISPEQDEVSGTEGQSVTLACNYMTDYEYVDLYWYKHHSDLQAPQFILWKRGKGGSSEHIPDKRKYGSQASATSTRLTIRELTLADTALYYCAVETQ
uniref:Ig-like domain-containing protein n=1 Tax=Stegastes partitus TaxID=144197 RepID=A0A3B5B6S5_9TELE